MDKDEAVSRTSLGRRYESPEAREKVEEETYQRYKHKTDTDIERERGVLRSLLETNFDVFYNEARMKGLDRVVHERQRRKERREWLAEMTVWGKLVATFGGGVVVGGGTVVAFVWKFVAQKFGLPGGS